ncbi:MULTISPECIES: acyltransferase family protein [unclassified Pseudomonas]|uniref:acyltransferase family protein n=1 Tax=unclassified Pseudomonas TaxID=196821 RepID=UPI000D36C46F|nr:MULTISPECIES: acyltransferase family protein [unclassified Pseudomonas]RAU48704.1 acyltransferase [Pseudomonas sp. RIT 409]RAU54036.1 acyltransferase [Pseudomonas sp. RIT 412]
MHTFGNRRDIDGLRALAVIPVVLYHFGFGVFSGGFVGVDVFFVISGFLITSIIVREIGAGRFSFVDFWARRARRIIPALTVMMLAALVVGWVLMPANDYSQLGRAVRYQAMFASNILFMRQDGYFNPASDFKPLLHTWSLSVEEQYYILFPLLMVALTRYFRHWRWILLGVLVVSFALNVGMVKRQPDAAFFLLPMRAWELLCGAMLAVLPASPRKLSPWAYQGVSLAGLLAVLYAILALDKYTPFPGWAALLPVLGATAMIWANGQGPTLVGRLLSGRVMVAVGLVSYSWYLWHWPVFVYANAVSVDGMQAREAGAWVVLTLVLAWLSWRLVELPFREKRLLPGRRPVLLAGLTALVVIGIAGQAVRYRDGVPERLSGQALQYAQARDWQRGQMECLLQRDSEDLRKICRFGGDERAAPRQLVWGDSHAAALKPAIEADAERYGSPVWLASLSGCPPILGHEPRQQCQAFNQATLQTVRDHGIRNVVLAARWSLYLYGEEDGDMRNAFYRDESRSVAQQEMARDLSAMVHSLRAAGATVWILKEVPLQRQGTVARLASLAMVGRSAEKLGRPMAEHLARQQFLNGLFGRLSAEDPNVRTLDPTPLMCPGGICRAEFDGHSQYMDENHLSDAGGERMQPLLAPIFMHENARQGG